MGQGDRAMDHSISLGPEGIEGQAAGPASVGFQRLASEMFPRLFPRIG